MCPSTTGSSIPSYLLSQVDGTSSRGVGREFLRTTADFAVSTAVKPIWHRDWDPLWAAAQECHVPISFHTTGYAVRQPTDEQMAQEYASERRATGLTLFQLAGVPSSWPASSSRVPWSATLG